MTLDLGNVGDIATALWPMPACRCGLPALRSTRNRGRQRGKQHFACPLGDRGCGANLCLENVETADQMDQSDLRTATSDGLQVVSLCRPFETPAMWTDMRCDCGDPMVVKRFCIGRFTISSPACARGVCKASPKIVLPHTSAHRIADAEQRREIPKELFADEAGVIKDCKAALIENITTL